MFGKETQMKSAMPQPTKQGLIGPPKLKMPAEGGDRMPRAANVGGRQSSALGNPLSPLPKAPLGPFKGGTPSLFHSSSTKARGNAGLGGIRPPK